MFPAQLFILDIEVLVLTAFRLLTEDVKNGQWNMLGRRFESTTLDLRPLMPYTLGANPPNHGIELQPAKRADEKVPE